MNARRAAAWSQAALMAFAVSADESFIATSGAAMEQMMKAMAIRPSCEREPTWSVATS
jgi:hypothetical protein